MKILCDYDLFEKVLNQPDAKAVLEQTGWEIEAVMESTSEGPIPILRVHVPAGIADGTEMPLTLDIIVGKESYFDPETLSISYPSAKAVEETPTEDKPIEEVPTEEVPAEAESLTSGETYEKPQGEVTDGGFESIYKNMLFDLIDTLPGVELSEESEKIIRAAAAMRQVEYYNNANMFEQICMKISEYGEQIEDENIKESDAVHMMMQCFASILKILELPEDIRREKLARLSSQIG